METSPKELFDRIKSIYPDHSTKICALHKPCTPKRQCKVGSNKEVLDFDEITKQENIKKSVESTSSVDAITYTDNNCYFCFVEIKGWYEFLYNSHRKKKVTKSEIQKQVDKYDLKKKLDNSIQLCKEITHNNIFENIPIYYIVVTDIDVNTNPLESLQGNLMFLAQTSSKWTDICNNLLKSKLDEITDIKKGYFYCRQFSDAITN